MIQWLSSQYSDGKYCIMYLVRIFIQLATRFNMIIDCCIVRSYALLNFVVPLPARTRYRAENMRVENVLEDIAGSE